MSGAAGLGQVITVPDPEHELRGSSCRCGGWTAPLGTSIWREFDKHLLAVRSAS